MDEPEPRLRAAWPDIRAALEAAAALLARSHGGETELNVCRLLRIDWPPDTLRPQDHSRRIREAVAAACIAALRAAQAPAAPYVPSTPVMARDTNWTGD